MKRVPILLIALFATTAVCQAETYGFRRNGSEIWKATCNTGMPSPVLSSMGGEAVVVLPYGNVLAVATAHYWLIEVVVGISSPRLWFRTEWYT